MLMFPSSSGRVQCHSGGSAAHPRSSSSSSGPSKSSRSSGVSAGGGSGLASRLKSLCKLEEGLATRDKGSEAKAVTARCLVFCYANDLAQVEAGTRSHAW
jgi:hypothetical protein